ncbi:hypothetical protein [Streptomyces sp. NPDC059788]|uniref:hypothetical protein n=1 Tax=Streptomyces sp. NPDC059788 TaxID=3346948 RepID=UPI003669139D
MTRSESNARPRPPAAKPPRGVTHVRHRHSSCFTVVGNHLALHPTLSATAVGLAVRIQALPDGARVSIRALAMQLPESEYRIARALNELEEAGYLERRRKRIAGQRIVTRTTYYEHPDDRPSECPPDPPPAPPAPHPHPVDTPEPPQEPAEPPKRSTPPKPSKRSKRSKSRKPPTPPRPSAPPDPPTTPPPPAFTPSPSTDLLSELRLADARLMLSVRDVTRLAPAVATWLSHGVAPEHVVRTLASDLPPGVIFSPAALLEYRLSEWLPPPLPVRPEVPRRVRDTTQECQFCGLPFEAMPAPPDPDPDSAPSSSSSSLVRCPRCRTAEAWTAAAPRPASLRNLHAPGHLRGGAAASVRTPADRTGSAAATAAPR